MGGSVAGVLDREFKCMCSAIFRRYCHCSLHQWGTGKIAWQNLAGVFICCILEKCSRRSLSFLVGSYRSLKEALPFYSSLSPCLRICNAIFSSSFDILSIVFSVYSSSSSISTTCRWNCLGYASLVLQYCQPQCIVPSKDIVHNSSSFHVTDNLVDCVVLYTTFHRLFGFCVSLLLSAFLVRFIFLLRVFLLFVGSSIKTADYRVYTVNRRCVGNSVLINYHGNLLYFLLFVWPFCKMH